MPKWTASCLVFVMAGAGMLWPLAAAHADNSDYFDLTPEQLLSAHVVSVSKKDEQVATAPAAVYVITAEDIARSGVNNIPDALRMAPGVDVAQIDADHYAISIRGFNQQLANKILVMIDGRIVYSPLFSGTYWEVQDYPMEDIDRIEVVRGPGGTLWGANAVNGVINIITKKAQDTQGGLISGGAGNVEKGFGTARYGDKFGDDGFYRVYGKFNDRASYEQPDGDSNHDESQNYRTGFRADWGGDKDANQYSLHGDAYNTPTDEFSQDYSFSAPYSTLQEETVESRGSNIMGVWDHKYDDGSSSKVQSYFDYTLRDQDLYRDSRSLFDFESQYNFAPIGRHEIAIGASALLDDDYLSGSSEIIFDPAHRFYGNYGVFAQDKITLAPDRLFLTLGSKFEETLYAGFDVQPNVRLSYTPDNRQTFWAAISRAVRTPSTEARDLDVTHIIAPPSPATGGLPLQYQITKNDDYDEENLIAYEIGYRNQLTPTVSLDTTAFANDYSDLRGFNAGTITTVNNGTNPTHLLLPLIFANALSGETYGAEVSTTWAVNKDWKLSANYSLLKIYLHGPMLNGASQETAEGQSPQQQFGFRSYWNISPKWTLDTMLYLVDELPAQSVNSYARLDLNLGYKINDNLHFNLIGQNLGDRQHLEYGPATPTAINVGEVPTSIFAKFTLRF